jgi:predicted  nucleic acid-binding Zn-ribbon protein
MKGMTNGAAGETHTISSGLDPALVNLLKLQEADMRRQQLEGQLAQAPRELANLQKKVETEKATFEARKKELQEMEVQRKDIDNQLKSAEAMVLKYKTQQIEVRKNEEYQALSHEIEMAEAKVEGLETQELEQMMKMDEAKKVLAGAEAEYKQRMASLDGEIALVKRREAQTRGELEAQGGAVETAATAVPLIWRTAYERSKQRAAKRPPFVAAIDDHKCGGCHLRTSNEVAEAARHGGKPVHCDNCGRVVYFPV